MITVGAVVAAAYGCRMAARDGYPGAQGFIPPVADLDALREAATTCRGCDLYANATQTVFGYGAPTAKVMLVGEQPGDVEDRRGLPFVGPAGQVLERGLIQAGIDRGTAYVTNAVKHFKFTAGGKRRIHATPDAAEVAACLPWLHAELALVTPVVLVALGATAGKALFGQGFRVTRSRGVLLDWPAGAGPAVVATIHPSAVLRADDSEAAYAGFVADLTVAAEALRRLAAS